MTCDTCRYAAWRSPASPVGQCTWRKTFPVPASSGIAQGALTVEGGHIWRGFENGCTVGEA